MSSPDEIIKFSEDMWMGRISDEERKSNPLFLAEGDLVEVADRIYFQVGFGNVTVVDTSDGIVLVDSGFDEMAEIIYNNIRSKFPNKQIIACIYTHGHIDHVGGLPEIQRKQSELNGPKIKVYAHQDVGNRFNRYSCTCGYNAHINSKQFRVNKNTDVFNHFMYPDVTYVSELDLTIGDTHMVLYHDKGETDDATWVHFPSVGVISTGDFFIWNVPNCGNPQKVQRYPLEWAHALKRMAKLKPKILIPGHGPLIIGEDRATEALETTADFLLDIYNQTIQLINQGLSLNEIIFKVKPHLDLMSKPYLRPLYDDPEFIVHNIWRLYCGWWDFELFNLRPACYTSLAKEITQLYPDVPEQIDHVEKLLNQSKIREAIFFVEMAYKANPSNQQILDTRSKVMDVAQEAESSLMAQSIFYAEKSVGQ